MKPNFMFVGYDTREDSAFDVCEHSLYSRATLPLTVIPLKQAELRELRLYDRPWRTNDAGQMIDDRDGKPFSTQFTFTRFLTPILGRGLGLTGWVGFCDLDFLFLHDVSELFSLVESDKAIMCVKHKHRPQETVKMDGCAQTVYDRKNWSSLVLWNLQHPLTRLLTAEAVNHEPGSWLHGFRWIPDDQIGALPEEWNWLEGHSSRSIRPKAVHFTRGGPWFEEWQRVEFGELWLEEQRLMRAAQSEV